MQLNLKKLINHSITLAFSAVIFLTGCSSQSSSLESSPLSKQNFVLGTVARITLYDHQSDELLEQAFSKLSELENTLSINKTNTLIDKINENSGIAPVEVDEETYSLIEKGIHYSELTSGAFDITVGPLVKLWNIGFADFKVPTATEIAETLPLLNYEFITLDPTNHSVYLEKKGMQLDLGGIGKGYAADEVASLLKENGVEHAIIDLGGNIFALGDKPGNKLWTIGVQDPFNPRGKSLGTLQVANKSLVTSGIYERFNTAEDGTRYHHILNPSTGYPFENEISGVSIISDSSTDGDALSTSTFALGVKEGLAFIESLDGIDAIFVTTDKKVYLTSGVKEQFKLTNSEYTLCE